MKRIRFFCTKHCHQIQRGIPFSVCSQRLTLVPGKHGYANESYTDSLSSWFTKPQLQSCPTKAAY
ncbi:hypothetical protein STEG23_015226, partial [Scotinomys teguina]